MFWDSYQQGCQHLDRNTRQEAKVTLRQKVRGTPSSGSYRKLLLVTLSPDMP